MVNQSMMMAKTSQLAPSPATSVLDADPLISMVTIDDQLSALYNVIKSSLALNNPDLASQLLSETEARSRLMHALTSYITLQIMKKELEGGSGCGTIDLQGKAVSVTKSILGSEKGVDALV